MVASLKRRCLTDANADVDAEAGGSAIAKSQSVVQNKHFA